MYEELASGRSQIDRGDVVRWSERLGKLVSESWGSIMQTQLLLKPSELMVQHLNVLRGYAGRVMAADGAPLTADEDADRVERMAEFRAISESFGLTGRDAATLLLKGLNDETKACDCHACSSRA